MEVRSIEHAEKNTKELGPAVAAVWLALIIWKAPESVYLWVFGRCNHVCLLFAEKDGTADWDIMFPHALWMSIILRDLGLLAQLARHLERVSSPQNGCLRPSARTDPRSPSETSDRFWHTRTSS